MTNAQQIFESAMILMDEVDEVTGETDTADTREYKNRTLGILNMLIQELYPYSDTCKRNGAGFRPVPPRITRFDVNIPLDDYMCSAVLPWGLAAQLVLDENPTAGNEFLQKYEENKLDARRGIPAESEDIVDVYGNDDTYNEFGRWG